MITLFIIETAIARSVVNTKSFPKREPSYYGILYYHFCFPYSKDGSVSANRGQALIFEWLKSILLCKVTNLTNQFLI